MCGKYGIESKTQSVVAESCDDGLCVDQAGDTRPTDVSLQLVQCESRRMQQGGGRAARNVIREECKGIATNWETKGYESGADTVQGKALVSEAPEASEGQSRAYGPPNS